MKTSLFFFLCLGLFVLTAAHPQKNARERADAMVNRIEKNIKLTDAQENKLEQIYTDYYNRLNELKQNNGTKADEQQLYNSIEQSVMKELTPSQQKEFSKIRLQKRENENCIKNKSKECKKVWDK